VVVVDNASDRGQSVTAVTRHGNDPEVLAILGPNSAAQAIPAAAVANELKVPLLTGTNTPAALTAGPWAFIAAQPAETTMPLLGNYALDSGKVRNCASFYASDNEASLGMSNEMRRVTEPRGMRFAEVVGVKTTESDFSAVATRVVAAKPDCVFLFSLANTAANFIVQLRQAGLPDSAKLYGNPALASDALIKLGGAAVEGTVVVADWMPGGASERGRAFAASYRKLTGKEADNWAALGYSYMTVIAHAIKAAGANPTREKIRDALAKTKNVPVVVGAGSYSFDERRMPNYGAVFLVVKGGAFVANQ
jgi:branched-chain amino acid transport system substrate-binding protein